LSPVIPCLTESFLPRHEHVMDDLDDSERLQVFAVLRHVVWSDGVLTPDELSALRGAAEALGVRGVGALMSEGERHAVPMVPRRTGARDLAFLAAAWIACVDGALEPEELALLSELRERGGIDEERAQYLLREAASAALTLGGADRASMNAAAWRRDLEALVSWCVVAPACAD
jgi:tellurite resistance protein